MRIRVLLAGLSLLATLAACSASPTGPAQADSRGATHDEAVPDTTGIGPFGSGAGG